MDAAYNDLKAGNLDVMDAMPSAAIGSYQDTFAGRSVNQPYAGIMTLTIPQYLDHFPGRGRPAAPPGHLHGHQP